MAEAEKRVPTRKCIGCREEFPKQQLIRIVKFNGEVFVDKTGKANGRGAYLCGRKDCLKASMKSRRLEKTFSMQIPAEIYDTLEKLSFDMEVQ